MLIAALGDVCDCVEGLEAGADDYLVQPFALAEFLARVHVMLRRSEKRNSNGAAAILSVGSLQMHLIERTVQRGDRPIKLQSVEFKLLEFLMRNAGRVIKRSALLENVWDLHAHPGTNILPTHISRLRSKVGADHGGELIRTVRGIGYLLRAD
jgi:two-component system, OmpR family, response regulator